MAVYPPQHKTHSLVYHRKTSEISTGRGPIVASSLAAQDVYCDTYSCDGGYTPISKASEVQCDDGKCGEDQCCELLCSCYMCPDDYSSVDGYDSLVCEKSGCTKKLCCEKDGEGWTVVLIGLVDYKAFK